jgi:hypothetical protein
MDLTLKTKFLESWKRYFGSAELPIVFYYTDEENRASGGLSRAGISRRAIVSGNDGVGLKAAEWNSSDQIRKLHGPALVSIKRS